MRIGIDCRLAGNRHAGIGRYIENLVQRLPKLADDVEWVFFFHDQEQADEVLAEVAKADQVSVVIAPIRHYTLAEQTRLLQIFKQNKLDLLHVPHFNVPIAYDGQMVVTIHDLLWHEYRGSHVTTLSPLKYWVKYWAYRWVAASAVRKAAQILVPAEVTKETLAHYYPDSRSKITVTKEGIGSAFKPAKLPRHPRELLYVGSLYPHKNVQLILEALKVLPEYSLSIVGSRNVFQDQVRARVAELGLKERVCFEGFLTDEALARKYQQCAALIQPSLFEGFGLTGVEAMACGTPVLASDIPVFKEIYQNGALFFDPHVTLSLVSAIQQLETESGKLIKNGLAVASKYSWDTMSKETLMAYRKAARR